MQPGSWMAGQHCSFHIRGCERLLQKISQSDGWNGGFENFLERTLAAISNGLC
jgi:hypothetical protein